MEKINEAIKRFLTINSGYGYGSGSGSGYGSGSGSGYGDGYGDGSGYGDGYGDGSGSGYGYGDGYGLKSFNNQNVYYIDGIPTVIERVKVNLAKGYIINEDLTTEKCYIVKNENLFAHGATLKEAQEALRRKIIENIDIDEKIEMFVKEFKPNKKYSAKVFFEWHHILTGSCEFGRNVFVRNHGINLESGMYEVIEFIEITKNDYGADVIKMLEERWKELYDGEF